MTSRRTRSRSSFLVGLFILAITPWMAARDDGAYENPVLFADYPDPGFGIHVVTADDPRGRWSEPVLVCGGKGLIDPCPFWDSDGRAHLIHASARSRAGVSNRLTLRELTADGQRTVGDGAVVIDGDQLPGWRTIEGPKLYRRGGRTGNSWAQPGPRHRAFARERRCPGPLPVCLKPRWAGLQSLRRRVPSQAGTLGRSEGRPICHLPE